MMHLRRCNYKKWLPYSKIPPAGVSEYLKIYFPLLCLYRQGPALRKEPRSRKVDTCGAVLSKRQPHSPCRVSFHSRDLSVLFSPFGREVSISPRNQTNRKND